MFINIYWLILYAQFSMLMFNLRKSFDTFFYRVARLSAYNCKCDCCKSSIIKGAYFFMGVIIIN